MSQPPKVHESARRAGLSAITSRWLEETDPAARKARGQYMTPRPVTEALLDRVGLCPGFRVLDPGAGTGELLRAALDREPRLEVVGWDIDRQAIEAARRLVPEAELMLRSALGRTPDGVSGSAGPERPFDLVIGNPPYFQLRLGEAERQRFARVISGRPNIFALFFQVALEQLRPGGTLAFIVPPSMNSGAYFEALREHLTDRAEVKDLTLLEGTGIFEGANTAIQLLVLEKNETTTSSASPAPAPKTPVGRISGARAGNPTHPGFVFRREVPEAGFRRVVFSADPARLAAEFEGRRTLWEVGLEAVTGQIVWNRNRDRLSEASGPGRVPLVWSHSIGENGLVAGPDGFEPSRPGKPGFYGTTAGGRPPLSGPAIVVNRVVGAVGRGELRAGLVPEGVEFLAENHVNVIRPRRPVDRGGSVFRRQHRKSDPPHGSNVVRVPSGGPESSDLPGTGLDWDQVLAALRRPGVARRVRLLTGNTQISARELTHLLPLELSD